MKQLFWRCTRIAPCPAHAHMHTCMHTRTYSHMEVWDEDRLVDEFMGQVRLGTVREILENCMPGGATVNDFVVLKPCIHLKRLKKTMKRLEARMRCRLCDGLHPSRACGCRVVIKDYAMLMNGPDV